MAGWSVNLTTLFPGQVNQHFLQILSLVTDNNPSWLIQWKEGERPKKLFHDKSPQKYGTGLGSNWRPLDLQSDSHLSIWLGNLNIFISLSAIPNLPYVGGAGLLLRTVGPNFWVNIDIEYSIIVINFHDCGKNTTDACQIIKDKLYGCRSTRIGRQIFCF